MARKPKPLPPYLEALMLLLEAQLPQILENGAELDRLGAIGQIEAEHQVEIDLDEERKAHPEFDRRYKRFWSRLTMGLEDSAVRSAIKGKGSATTILRGLGALNGAGHGQNGGGNSGGRLVLNGSPREDYRRW